MPGDPHDFAGFRPLDLQVIDAPDDLVVHASAARETVGQIAGRLGNFGCRSRYRPSLGVRARSLAGNRRLGRRHTRTQQCGTHADGNRCSAHDPMPPPAAHFEPCVRSDSLHIRLELWGSTLLVNSSTELAPRRYSSLRRKLSICCTDSPAVSCLMTPCSFVAAAGSTVPQYFAMLSSTPSWRALLVDAAALGVAPVSSVAGEPAGVCALPSSGTRATANHIDPVNL